MIVPFIMAGAGMALVFAPSANAVLSAVRPDQAGQASGATNAIRETGGVLGVAVLASIFTHAGGYGSPQAFVNGLAPGAVGGRGDARAPARSRCSLLPFPTRRGALAASTRPAGAPTSRRRGAGRRLVGESAGRRPSEALADATCPHAASPRPSAARS